jgi:hypothetical protein
MKPQLINIKEEFKTFNIITTNDLFNFYKSSDTKIKKTTVNWRIYELVQRGELQRVGRGKFIIGKERKYLPEFSVNELKIKKLISNGFPYIKYCIWNTLNIKEFFQHLSALNFIVVEVEKDAFESVYFLLKENFGSVFKKPKREIVEEFIIHKQNSIIINSFVSEAPIENVNNMPTSSLEKLLVDLYCEQNLFYFLQGSELTNIYKNAFEKYTVNQSKLLRYANRRRKRQEIEMFIKSIIRQ